MGIAAKIPVKILALSLLAMLAAGCASNVPRGISTAPSADLTVADVRTDIPRHVDTSVRWGGTIVAIENDDEQSRVEIISRKLRRDGRPLDEDGSFGRFIAVFDGFLDPAVYFEGRDITVFGAVEGEFAGQIGNRAYTYPLVRVQEHQLWRRFSSTDPYPYMPGYRLYYYDPFYYPWGYYHPPRFRPDPTPSRPSILRD